MPRFRITWTESKTLTSVISAETEEEALDNFEFDGEGALDYNADITKYWMSPVELVEIPDLDEED